MFLTRCFCGTNICHSGQSYDCFATVDPGSAPVADLMPCALFLKDRGDHPQNPQNGMDTMTSKPSET